MHPPANAGRNHFALIVGYNTININKEYTLLTVNFQAVDGGALPLEQAFPWTEGMTEAKAYSSADNIQVMNASGGYDTYFRWNGAAGKSGSPDPTKEGWAYIGKTEQTPDSFPVGRGAWFQTRNPSSTAKLRFVNPVGKKAE